MEKYKSGVGTWKETLFFKIDSQGKRTGYAIRLECIANIYHFVTYEDDLFRAQYWFLKKKRPEAQDPLKFDNLDEAFNMLQEFASENALKPFILG